MPERPEFQLTDASHGMNVIAEALYDEHMKLCANVGISPMDFAAALANVQAWILAGSRDMPEAVAMSRIDDLAEVARRAYREQRHGQKASGRG